MILELLTLAAVVFFIVFVMAMMLVALVAIGGIIYDRLVMDGETWDYFYE